MSLMPKVEIVENATCFSPWLPFAHLGCKCNLEKNKILCSQVPGFLFQIFDQKNFIFHPKKRKNGLNSHLGGKTNSKKFSIHLSKNKKNCEKQIIVHEHY